MLQRACKESWALLLCIYAAFALQYAVQKLIVVNAVTSNAIFELHCTQGLYESKKLLCDDKQGCHQSFACGAAVLQELRRVVTHQRSFTAGLIKCKTHKWNFSDKQGCPYLFLQSSMSFSFLAEQQCCRGLVQDAIRGCVHIA